MKIIALSIDVTQLDKARFKSITRKNGKPAVFAELVLIETPGGQYGDWMVKQGVTKEERAVKKEMPIIGNGKNLGGRVETSPQPNSQTPPESDDVPF